MWYNMVWYVFLISVFFFTIIMIKMKYCCWLLYLILNKSNPILNSTQLSLMTKALLYYHMPHAMNLMSFHLICDHIHSSSSHCICMSFTHSSVTIDQIVQINPVQYSTVQYSTVQYSTVQDDLIVWSVQ